MLEPVLPYSAEGMIWYQGESNVSDSSDYKELFTAFVENVRKINRPDLPVIFTQIAKYSYPFDPSGERLAALREQQRQCLSVPLTAMADAYDCGEWNDLHPLDKRTVARRLAERVY
jgi:sialate O-acetylesterase